jgi:segregation and condensation protein B
LFTASGDLSSDPEYDPEISEQDPDVSRDDQLSLALQGQGPDADEGQNQVDTQPQWDRDPVACMRRLEAVLLLAKTPLTSRKLSQLAGLDDGTQARTMVRALAEHYDKVGRAFQVKRVAGGFQLRTRPQFAKWLRRLEHVPKPTRLSAPMMETLAVVAYRQPIIKAEIEAVRGVSCGEILRQLLESGLVKIAGRSSELGRPFLYATSREFLTEFGLNSLEDLPRAEQLSGTGLPQWVNTDHDSQSGKPTKPENFAEQITDSHGDDSETRPDEEE